MKTTKSTLFVMSLAIVLFSVSFCGKGKKELSEKGKLLISKQWKYDANANLKDGSNNIDSASGIKSDIQLKGDVGKIADFLSETLVFGHDSKDDTKLSYSRTIGEGMLSSSVLGFWEMGADDKSVILKEWDNQAGKEKEPVSYEIVEITAEKLVLKKQGDLTTSIYLAK